VVPIDVQFFFFSNSISQHPNKASNTNKSKTQKNLQQISLSRVTISQIACVHTHKHTHTHTHTHTHRTQYNNIYKYQTNLDKNRKQMQSEIRGTKRTSMAKKTSKAFQTKLSSKLKKQSLL
jgi:hypothetical protein